MAEKIRESSTATIVFAWLLVGVPLAWGVYSTFLNSMKLFYPQ